MRLFSIFLVTAVLSACVSFSPTKPPQEEQSELSYVAPTSPAAQRIMDDIVWLSDDERAGREPGTPGYKASADFVAKRFAYLGLKPGGEKNSYFQTVPLRSSKRDLENSALSLTIGGQSKELTAGVDFMPSIPANGVYGAATGDLVFVGYGLSAPDFGIDDYSGVDLNGKIAVVLLGRPPKTDMPSEEAAHYGSSTTLRKAIAAHGGIGMIGIYTESYAKRIPWERMQARADRAQMRWLTEAGTTYNPAQGFKVSVVLNPDYSDQLFDSAGYPLSEILQQVEKGIRPAAFDMGIKASMKSASTSHDIQSRNVIAIFEGSDPQLKDEYVVLSAHLDHIGQSPVAEGEDGINNGAMDNAVGISTMLEAARKFTKAEDRPRRSILFVAVTAEEKGLLGSEYFAVNPTVPADNMVADVNLDMPIITYDFTDVIAFGAQHSSLQGLVQAAAESMGVALTPDPVPQMALFVRSDHYRFVQQGIPSVFLFLGFADGGEEAFQTFMSTNYHRPSDEYQMGLNFNAGAKFAKLNYLIAREIASGNERPRWNEDSFFGQLYGKD
ncbi:MAG: M28 family metallopeptidase [bacterium]